MFKIAICDDTKEDQLHIVSILNDYVLLQADKQKIEYTVFQNAIELIGSLKSGHHYQLVLLDIFMPYMTGMDAAKEIRQLDSDMKIIFLTSSTEFAVESYAVAAYYYIIKPLTQNILTQLLDKIIFESKNTLDESFVVKSKIGLTRIYINQLEFAEIFRRTILYHLTDHTIIEAVGSIIKLGEELLKNSQFVKPHRSYIVNIKYINTMNQREIKMQSSALIPIAKANYPTIKSAYIEYSFREVNKNV